MSRLILNVIFLLSFCCAEAQLRVSSNNRFLETSDGKPFFWLGDTAWELFHRLKEFQPPTTGYGRDWVLVIDDASKNYSIPPSNK